MDAAVKAECMPEAATRACTCASGGTGQKTCTAGNWSDCTSCSTRDAGPRPVIKELCKAGYYVGHMEGKYKPGFASLGIAESLFEVDFESEAVGDNPPLALTLTENREGTGEFASFTVGGGCMVGLARSGDTDNPFVARLTGELDCKTGDFNGVMKGVYTLLNFPGLDYDFEGPITAHFIDQELADGEWSADEPPALNGQPAGGGAGSWGATWQADQTPDLASDPCARLDADGG
jgi:hypothetical protein